MLRKELIAQHIKMLFFLVSLFLFFSLFCTLFDYYSALVAMDWNLWSGIWTPIGAIATLLGAWFFQALYSCLFWKLQARFGFRVPNRQSADRDSRCENSLGSLKEALDDLSAARRDDRRRDRKIALDILAESQRTNRLLEQLLVTMNSRPSTAGEWIADVQLRLHRPSAAGEGQQPHVVPEDVPSDVASG